MPRLARVVVPGEPHHITQRGNRRQRVFFCDEDYQSYIDLMSHWCAQRGVAVWAYCLMPNHVHLVAVPAAAESLRLAVGEAHRRYTRMINFREGWRGYLWQGRFASFVMDCDYLLACARYVELNPVRAGLVARPEDWRWSSAAAHLAGRDDALVQAGPLLERVPYGWADFLGVPVTRQDAEMLKRHASTGWPLGSRDFVKGIEVLLGRSLLPRKAGRKPKKEEK